MCIRDRLTPFQIKAIALWIDHGAVWSTKKTKLFYEAPLSLDKPVLTENRTFHNPIDIWVDAYFKEKKIKWPELISDEAFIRKVYLDITGLLPTTDAVLHFRNDNDRGKSCLLYTSRCV